MSEREREDIFLPSHTRSAPFILRYIHTKTQIIYALQERGDLELETVDLIMEPEGYSVAILVVHMVLLRMEYI